MAEGVGWKLAPMRVFEEGCELALDNDCILWDRPAALAAWLEGEPDTCLIAEDVRACFGQFADLCGPEPRNSGLRGLPPRFDLGTEIERVLIARDAILRSELDEQGLQVAALLGARPTHTVALDDVTICSPFPTRIAPTWAGVACTSAGSRRSACRGRSSVGPPPSSRSSTSPPSAGGVRACRPALLRVERDVRRGCEGDLARRLPLRMTDRQPAVAQERLLPVAPGGAWA